MTSLVTELQREALDRSVPAADLLRKALVAARKLKIEGIQAWLKSELNGYADSGEIPEYRLVNGEIKAFNPYNGMWLPIMLAESMAEEHRSLTNRKCGQSVAELEDLLANKSGMLAMPYPFELTARMTRAIDLDSPPMLIVSAAKLRGILDATRTAVLEWALQLEEQGVTGEGFSFSKEEQTAAARVVFNIGSMSHSQIQGGTSNSTQALEVSGIDLDEMRNFVKDLHASLSSLKLGPAERDELTQEIVTIKAQLGSPKPKLAILRESSRSIRNILEGATGSALATEIVTRLGTLIGV